MKIELLTDLFFPPFFPQAFGPSFAASSNFRQSWQVHGPPHCPALHRGSNVIGPPLLPPPGWNAMDHDKQSSGRCQSGLRPHQKNKKNTILQESAAAQNRAKSTKLDGMV